MFIYVPVASILQLMTTSDNAPSRNSGALVSGPLKSAGRDRLTESVINEIQSAARSGKKLVQMIRGGRFVHAPRAGNLC